MGRPGEDRWVEVSPSQFSHEADGLALVRALLPDQPPFRAWSNFEFRDNRGRWHEVDLLVLGRNQLHLVELKYYSGVLRGDDHTWRRDGRRAEQSPLKLARRKAQYLRSLLDEEYERWKRERKVMNAPPARDAVPFVSESVFLHHPRFVSELEPRSAINLFGPDGHQATTRLPGISTLLLAPARPEVEIRELMLVELMKRVGLVQRREREAGSWVIQDQPVADGEGWQEWDAYHRLSQARRGRIRFLVPAPGSSPAEQRRLRSLAEHEYTVLRRLRHDAVMQPDDLVESELGIGLVYPYEEGWQRLDLWLADQPQAIALETALSILRQVAEAVQYAHGHKVVHRGLSPEAVWVRSGGGHDLAVQVRGWQGAGMVSDAGTRATAAPGVTSLFNVDASGRDTDAADAWLDAFAAPEGALSAGVDRVRVDVFGLGALAFYLVAAQPAARSIGALRTRLREQSGLDLAAELPQVSSALRRAVLHATRPAVSERTADVAAFLTELSEEERRDTDHDPVLDPVTAAPGAVLDNRFRMVRRLGSGSTAVGLLVRDLSRDGEPEVVLKVAVDDAAAPRLDGEAEVLATLRSPRIVSLLEPLSVGGRRALLLENAGPETLAQRLRPGVRLSLDLLERWGTDLLEALAALDRAGVDHRDIKPANLGVTSGNKDALRLVLFDFSLSRAAAAAVRAGTPPYLDPFLGTAGRPRYDSAAERYAAAVVLFEMASGGTPTFGDGQSDPAAIPDEARVVAELFDPTLGQALVGFFSRALARDADARFDTVADMLGAWQLVFSQTQTGQTPDAPDLRAAATPDTPLIESGLSARALSALEPLGVRTVADLVAVDATRLRRMSGAVTTQEITAAAKEWRSRYGRRRPREAAAGLPDPYEAGGWLLQVAQTGRGTSRADVVARLLGTTGGVDGFATQAQLGAGLTVPVGAARVSQILDELQSLWAAEDRTRSLLDRLGQVVAGRLGELGDVATVPELAAHLLGLMDPAADAGSSEARIAVGLVRLALGRQQALLRAGDDAVTYAVRRRSGRPAVVATRPELLDLADALGPRADQLVRSSVEVVVPVDRVLSGLGEVLGAAVDVPAALTDPDRLVRLAAALSEHAAASGRRELHDRTLDSAAALGKAVEGLAGGEALTVQELRERVAVRFPALVPLPEQPRLSDLVTESGAPLRWEPRTRRFQSGSPVADTTGLQSRVPTALALDPAPVAVRGVVGQRLADSTARRSFLALAVSPTDLPRLQRVLEWDHRAEVVSLTGELLDALHAAAEQAGLPWASVLEADRQPTDSRAGRGLAVLVSRALDVVEERIDARLGSADDAPLVLVEAAPLARYGSVGRLGRWTDLARGRSRPLWLVVPQLQASRGAVLDGRPLPLTSPSQFVPVDADWISARLQERGDGHPPAERSARTLVASFPDPPTGRSA